MLDVAVLLCLQQKTETNLPTGREAAHISMLQPLTVCQDIQTQVFHGRTVGVLVSAAAVMKTKDVRAIHLQDSQLLHLILVQELEMADVVVVTVQLELSLYKDKKDAIFIKNTSKKSKRFYCI
jgi:hypothetical protein